MAGIPVAKAGANRRPPASPATPLASGGKAANATPPPDTSGLKQPSGKPGAAKTLARKGPETSRNPNRAVEGSSAAPAPAVQPEDAVSAPVERAAASMDASGLLITFFGWAWFGMPLFTGGPDRVKKVLRAKFLNKAG